MTSFAVPTIKRSAVHSASQIAALIVPSARIDVWEMEAGETGWLYGVQATSLNGGGGFAGMVWNHDRFSDRELTSIAEGTDATALSELSANISNRAKPPISRLAELALLKLALGQVGSRPNQLTVRFYVSELQEASSKFRTGAGMIVKKSFATFQPGEEERRPIALDAQFLFGSWQEATSFCRKHPKLVWLEDPVPDNLWHADPVGMLPLATGERATSVLEVENILRHTNLMRVVAHLELSQLGPVAMAACIESANGRNVPVIFHGHLPFDTALILDQLGVEGLIELNVPHLSERVPWPYAAGLLASLTTDGHLTITESFSASVLSASVPVQAMKRT
ncbi:hypothetical protein [Bradyrhizobium yuanmingense]|uniref:hypothetical protein n=1 Tax=Bradyrhizobium yuanmingense TaxID=108015 RepID=UPI0023B990E6|nr:hypothetical protein [Bradyrhizobium yuanmingense]MDF0492758.1 hypothetical protein [Bradyrhizobium yuanmingense]